MTSAKDVRPTTIVTKTPEEMKLKIKGYIRDLMLPLLELNGNISVGVSGGSMPKLLCDVLSAFDWRMDWTRLKIFMVDERLVPPTDKECTYMQYVQLLPKHIKDCVIPVQLHESPQKAAAQYEQRLLTEIIPEKIGKVPRFDILFLGMGPDGHTASLFPNHRLTRGDSLSWVGWLDDSPKPPPSRVTLTFNAINVSRNVAFIITGENKAEVVKAVLERDPAYPSSLVKPMNGKLTFFLDEEAASKLPKQKAPLQPKPQQQVEPEQNT